MLFKERFSVLQLFTGNLNAPSGIVEILQECRVTHCRKSIHHKNDPKHRNRLCTDRKWVNAIITFGIGHRQIIILSKKCGLTSSRNFKRKTCIDFAAAFPFLAKSTYLEGALEYAENLEENMLRRCHVIICANDSGALKASKKAAIFMFGNKKQSNCAKSDGYDHSLDEAEIRVVI